jgi:hypothetical protein
MRSFVDLDLQQCVQGRKRFSLIRCVRITLRSVSRSVATEQNYHPFDGTSAARNASSSPR